MAAYLERGRFRRSSPRMQNLISGLCLFLTAGIYHAITGLGAGGGKPSSIRVATTTNAVLYVLFTVVGFFGGSVLNKIGPKFTYLIGCFGYPFYVTGLWYYDAQGKEWYPLLGGAVLGITAGLLWTAANFIQFAYPEERDKGQFIGLQLCMLATGSTIGAVIPFAINFHSASSSGVPTSVYIIFTIIMLSSMLVVLIGIVRPENVTRDDGTHLAVFEAVHFREEVAHCLGLLRDWRILLLVLPLFSTEITLSLIPTLNAHACNLRTRSLNNLLYWTIQLPSAWLFSKILDNDRLRRRTRGMIALTFNVILSILGWGLAIGIQKRFDITREPFEPTWDWTSAHYGWMCALILVFGILFIINQMLVMWTVGALSNDPRIAGRTGGFAKAMLSAGLAVAFGMEAGKTPYLTQTTVQIALQFTSFAMMAVIVWRAVKDTNYLDEIFVIPPVHIEMELDLGPKGVEATFVDERRDAEGLSSVKKDE